MMHLLLFTNKKKTLSNERDKSYKKEMRQSVAREPDMLEKKMRKAFINYEKEHKTIESKYDDIPKAIDNLDLLPRIELTEINDTKGENLFKKTTRRRTETTNFGSNLSEFDTFNSNIMKKSNWGIRNDQINSSFGKVKVLALKKKLNH